MVLAVLVAAGCGASQLDQPGSSRVSRSTSDTPPCRSDPLAGVHDPTRLKVLEACATFVGTMIKAPKLNPSDRDVTFNVAPDSAYASMLNGKNRSEGGIHIEIVPIDQPGCTPGQPLRGPRRRSRSLHGRKCHLPAARSSRSRDWPPRLRHVGRLERDPSCLDGGDPDAGWAATP